MSLVMQKAKHVLQEAELRATRGRRAEAFDAMLRDGFPPALGNAVRYLISGSLSSPVDKRVASEVAAVRTALAAKQGDASVLYSPKPGSAGDDISTDARPHHGEQKRFDLKRVAYETSTPERWGMTLYLVAKGVAARHAIELGSCAGISGAYIVSAPSIESFLTIEGSAELAAHARESIASVSRIGEVVTGLFDDVLDERLPSLHDIDFAWIDGHHEQIATIHYFQRLIPTLRPGAAVLFDDVSWSQDMRDGWNRLAVWPGFSHTVDLGKLGIGIWDGGDVHPRQWDVRTIIGARMTTGSPHGWDGE